MSSLGGYLLQLTRLRNNRKVLMELVSHLDQLGIRDSDGLDDIDEYIFSSSDEVKSYPREAIEEVRLFLQEKIAAVEKQEKTITNKPVAGEPRRRKGEKR